MAAIATVAVVLWLEHQDTAWADVWLPGVAMECTGLLIATLVVDVVVEGERRRRRIPRTKAAVDGLNDAFATFIESLYPLSVRTPGSTPLRFSNGVVEAIDQFGDALRDVALTDEERLWLAGYFERLGDDLDRVRVRDGDVLEEIDPELPVEIDGAAEMAHAWGTTIPPGVASGAVTSMSVNARCVEGKLHQPLTFPPARRAVFDRLARAWDPATRVLYEQGSDRLR